MTKAGGTGPINDLPCWVGFSHWKSTPIPLSTPHSSFFQQAKPLEQSYYLHFFRTWLLPTENAPYDISDDLLDVINGHCSHLILDWLAALVPSSFVKQAFLDLGDTAHLLVSLLSSCWTVLLWPLNIPLGWVFSLSCWDNWNKACLPRPTPVLLLSANKPAVILSKVTQVRLTLSHGSHHGDQAPPLGPVRLSSFLLTLDPFTSVFQPHLYSFNSFWRFNSAKTFTRFPSFSFIKGDKELPTSKGHCNDEVNKSE